jgi:predicted transposase/invertase (TIGR01784 family)
MLSSALKKRDKIQFEQGIEKEIEKDIQKGMHTKAIETAKALLKEKMAIEKNACVTGLSIDEIKKLK